MTKKDWLASESAPDGYPMKIVTGTFLYPGENRGLYIPNGKTVDYGWGEEVSTHVVGPDQKPLPDRMVIIFYSFTEDVFYRGEFDLPYETIVELFDQGFTGLRDRSDNRQYRVLLAGVAPGGSVAVWAAGAGKTKEVFFGQAEPIDFDWAEYWRRMIQSEHPGDREDYRMRVLTQRLPENAIKRLESEGIPHGKWERMRSRFLWRPQFFRMSQPSEPMSVKYINGERYHMRAPYDETFPIEPLPAPKELRFVSDGYLYVIEFDEDEMIEVFDKMADGDNPLFLDIAPGVPRSETAVRLRNQDDEHTALERFSVREINRK